MAGLRGGHRVFGARPSILYSYNAEDFNFDDAPMCVFFAIKMPSKRPCQKLRKHSTKRPISINDPGEPRQSK